MIWYLDGITVSLTDLCLIHALKSWITRSADTLRAAINLITYKLEVSETKLNRNRF